MTNKDDELLRELHVLHARADYHFEEASGYVQAAYHVACDLQRHQGDTGAYTQAIKAMLAFASELHKQQESLKTLLTGVEDDESKSQGRTDS